MRACTHTHTFQKDLGTTLHINHPSNRPHLLLSTTPELFTRQTAPEGRARRLTGSARPASACVCVYPCQASGPNRCDQLNQDSTAACCVNSPAPAANTHTQTKKGPTEEQSICWLFACCNSICCCHPLACNNKLKPVSHTLLSAHSIGGEKRALSHRPRPASSPVIRLL